MVWNWQQPDWPNFSWNPLRLAKAEQHFLRGGGVLVGMVKHLGPEDRELLTVEAISTEAITTSEIEGEMLDRASVQSSIRRQLGLATDKRRVGAAEQGVAEMMVDLFRTFSAPLSGNMLFSWHRMLMHSRRDIKDIGRYRTENEPMQVVSGAIHAPEVHFEAPASVDVPGEIVRFIAWFNRTAPTASEALPAVTRAAIAHLFFVSIRPFEDGNGRIGRAIAEKALAQGLGQPSLTALAATILTRRKA
jgi:Fic family protein